MAFKLPDQNPREENIFHEPDAQMPMEWKRCLCGKMFEPYRSFQRFCSEACREKYWKTKSYYVKKTIVTLMCKECGKPFETNDDKRKYCSKTCYSKHEASRRKPKEKRKCMICGKTFETSHWSKRYCSERCRLEARRVS